MSTTIPTPTDVPTGFTPINRPQPSSVRLPRKAHPTKWIYNDKIKTCKCSICGYRVEKSSLKCDSCGVHICSECLDLDSERYAVHKIKARHNLDNDCWPCHHRSNMHPSFSKRYLCNKKKGPKQEVLEEDLQALKSGKKMNLKISVPRASGPKPEESDAIMKTEVISPTSATAEEISRITLDGKIAQKRKRSQDDEQTPDGARDRKRTIAGFLVFSQEYSSPSSFISRPVLRTLEDDYEQRVKDILADRDRREARESAIMPKRARSEEARFRIPPRWT